MKDTVNPYSIETRYTLDFMGYLLHARQPRSVRVYSDSVEMVKAVVRRLGFNGCHLFVDSEEIRAAVQTSLGLEVQVGGREPAEAAFCPLSLDGTTLPDEEIIVAATQNAFSYKSLLYPGQVRTTALGTLARVRQHYQVEQVIGLYSPRFVALLALAHLAGRRSSSTYFRLSDLAMRYLYTFGPLWRLSYVVIFAGHR